MKYLLINRINMAAYHLLLFVVLFVCASSFITASALSLSLSLFVHA